MQRSRKSKLGPHAKPVRSYFMHNSNTLGFSGFTSPFYRKQQRGSKQERMTLLKVVTLLAARGNSWQKELRQSTLKPEWNRHRQIVTRS